MNRVLISSKLIKIISVLIVTIGSMLFFNLGQTQRNNSVNHEYQPTTDTHNISKSDWWHQQCELIGFNWDHDLGSCDTKDVMEVYQVLTLSEEMKEGSSPLPDNFSEKGYHERQLFFINEAQERFEGWGLDFEKISSCSFIIKRDANDLGFHTDYSFDHLTLKACAIYLYPSNKSLVTAYATEEQ